MAAVAASTLTTKTFDEAVLLKDYQCILNSGNCNSHCNYGHPACVTLSGIQVTGELKAMSEEENISRILRTANEVLLQLRILAHHQSKPNDEHLIPGKLQRLKQAQETYDQVAKETGLAAASIPSYEFLRLTAKPQAASSAIAKTASAVSKK